LATLILHTYQQPNVNSTAQEQDVWPRSQCLVFDPLQNTAMERHCVSSVHCARNWTLTRHYYHSCN